MNTEEWRVRFLCLIHLILCKYLGRSRLRSVRQVFLFSLHLCLQDNRATTTMVFLIISVNKGKVFFSYFSQLDSNRVIIFLWSLSKIGTLNYDYTILSSFAVLSSFQRVIYCWEPRIASLPSWLVSFVRFSHIHKIRTYLIQAHNSRTAQ